MRNTMILLRVLVLLLVCLNVTGCSTTMPQGELLKKLREEPALVIVDVRTRHEYATDHLPGAVHIPFYGIGSGLKDRGVLKNEQIVLYCEHGPRAGLAGLALYLRGYARVYSLEGHMQGWRTKGLPIENGVR